MQKVYSCGPKIKSVAKNLVKKQNIGSKQMISNAQIVDWGVVCGWDVFLYPIIKSVIFVLNVTYVRLILNVTCVTFKIFYYLATGKKKCNMCYI